MTANPRPRRRRGGFTLLEVALGMTVLSVAVLVALHTQIVSMRLQRSTQELDLARMQAVAALDEILLTSHDEIPTSFPPDVDLPEFEPGLLSQQSVQVQYDGWSDGMEVPELLEIRVLLSWRAFGGQTQTFRIATLSSR